WRLKFDPEAEIGQKAHFRMDTIYRKEASMMKKGKHLLIIAVIAGLFLGFLGAIEDAAAGGKILIYSPWKDKVMKQFTALFEEKTGI
ncbi:hypothetical protein C6A37_13070, partial [Desulfobacteraceae bacterium SEEP-SAG9]